MTVTRIQMLTDIIPKQIIKNVLENAHNLDFDESINFLRNFVNRDGGHDEIREKRTNGSGASQNSLSRTPPSCSSKKCCTNKNANTVYEEEKKGKSK